ncbi:MAG: hypothetical protein KC416_13845, partial [Myxococcales bacterium]|nr:hypothetical protein [Myxococcales bacterium]
MLSLRHVTTISLGLLLSLTGCETGATGKAPPPGQATAALASDWRADLETTRDQVKKNDPALYSELTALQPRKTRAGFPRFISKALHRPEAFAFLVDRFLTGDDPEPVRAALIEAMPATQFAF